MKIKRCMLSSRLFWTTVATMVTAGANLTSTAFAIPLVYECHVIDYSASGEVKSEFQYNVGAGGYRNFKTHHSEIRLNYDKKNSALAISLRPSDDVETYARREDRGTPLQVSLTHVGPGYAATVRCRL